MNQTSDPTPEEIAETCRQIREGWSEFEEQKRRKWTQSAPVVTPRARVRIHGGTPNEVVYEL